MLYQIPREESCVREDNRRKEGPKKVVSTSEGSTNYLYRDDAYCPSAPFIRTI